MAFVHVSSEQKGWQRWAQNERHETINKNGYFETLKMTQKRKSLLKPLRG